MEIFGYALAVLVGTTLGLIGSGGAILAVPILVYIMEVEPVTATAYSLFIVGTTALVGGAEHARKKQVDFKTAFCLVLPPLQRFMLPGLGYYPGFLTNSFIQEIL